MKKRKITTIVGLSDLEYGPFLKVLRYLSYDDIFKCHIEVVCKAFNRSVEQSLSGRDLCLYFGGSYHTVTNLNPKNYPCTQIWIYPKGEGQYSKNYSEIRDAIDAHSGTLYKIANILDFSYTYVFPLKQKDVENKMILYNYKRGYALKRGSKLMYKIIKSAKWTKRNLGVLYQVMMERQQYFGYGGLEQKVEEFCGAVFKKFIPGLSNSVDASFRLLMEIGPNAKITPEIVTKPISKSSGYNFDRTGLKLITLPDDDDQW